MASGIQLADNQVLVSFLHPAEPKLTFSLKAVSTIGDIRREILENPKHLGTSLTFFSEGKSLDDASPLKPKQNIVAIWGLSDGAKKDTTHSPIRQYCIDLPLLHKTEEKKHLLKLCKSISEVAMGVLLRLPLNDSAHSQAPLSRSSDPSDVYTSADDIYSSPRKYTAHDLCLSRVYGHSLGSMPNLYGFRRPASPQNQESVSLPTTEQADPDLRTLLDSLGNDTRPFFERLRESGYSNQLYSTFEETYQGFYLPPSPERTAGSLFAPVIYGSPRDPMLHPNSFRPASPQKQEGAAQPNPDQIVSDTPSEKVLPRQFNDPDYVDPSLYDEEPAQAKTEETLNNEDWVVL